MNRQETPLLGASILLSAMGLLGWVEHVLVAHRILRVMLGRAEPFCPFLEELIWKA